MASTSRMEAVPQHLYKSYSQDHSTITVSADSLNTMDKYPLAACWRQSSQICFSTAASDDIRVNRYKIHKKKKTEEIDLVAGEQDSGFAEGDLFSTVEQKRPSTLTCQVEDHIFTGSNNPTMSSTYMLGVLDKKTKELCLVPFQDMFPRMCWTAPPEPDSRDVFTPPPEEEDAVKKLKNSTTPGMSQFSAPLKRKKKSEKTEESFHSDMKGDAEEMIKFTETDANIDVEALMVQPKDADLNLEIGAGIRPDPNLSARKPDGLYDWNELLPPDEVTASFFGMADELLAGKPADLAKWKKTSRFSLYFTAVLEKVLRTKKSEEADPSMRMANMLLVNYLCHLLNHRDRPLKDKELLPAEVPAVAARYLIENFTEASEFVKGKRIVTEKIKDKIIARIILLVLFVEKFAADVSMFIAPMSPKDRARIPNIASICGGKYLEKTSRGKSTYTVTLSYPWQFPKMSTGNTPKKRKR